MFSLHPDVPSPLSPTSSMADEASAAPAPAASSPMPASPGPSPALAGLLQRLGPQAAGMGGPSAPQGNPGSAAQAMLKVRSIIKQLEEVLPDIPMETPLHEKILSTLKQLMTAMPDENPDLAGPQSALLLNVLRQASTNAPMASLARLGGASAPAGMPQGPQPGVAA